jgi:hypothetical protein
MWRLLHVFIASVLTVFAMPAFADNHTGIDQWGHFKFHLEQMFFWLSRGEWSLALYQADCTQDPLSKLLFVHGGMMWIVTGSLMFLMLFSVRKRIAQAFHQTTWYLRFQKTRFA